MEVLELRSRHCNLNEFTSRGEKCMSFVLFCFAFPMALLILQSQMDVGWLYFVVVTFDRMGSYVGAELQYGMKAFRNANASTLYRVRGLDWTTWPWSHFFTCGHQRQNILIAPHLNHMYLPFQSNTVILLLSLLHLGHLHLQSSS